MIDHSIWVVEASKAIISANTDRTFRKVAGVI